MHFTDKEKEEIKEAVQHVESVTAGEVVPFITKQSDDYNEASWLLVILLGFFPMLVLISLNFLYFAISTETIVTISGTLTLLAWFAPRLSPSILRLVLSPKLLGYRAYQRAQEAFLQEQVFQTEDRIGILIFISELEHQVIVLADKGINDVVENDTWSSIVDHVVSGIKKKNTAKGLVNAIYTCEHILLEHGFENRIKDSNELSDDLRID